VFTITYAIAGTGGTIGPFTKGSKQDPPANVTLPIVPRLPDVSDAAVAAAAAAAAEKTVDASRQQ
jgi:hypothetical protein